MQKMNRLKQKALSLKSEAYVLYLASKDKRVPWYAKALAAVVIAYLLSPIDLIPDFIPVIGYLDDIILVPAGIALTIRWIPAEALEEFRQRARKDLSSVKGRWIAAGIIGAIWLLLLVYFIKIIISVF
jgi:uncharacterized membrane protein YkvA (DUF1232 family)